MRKLISSVIKNVFIGVIVSLVVGSIFGVVVMLLWNNTVVDIFNWPKINILQAVGLFVLGNLLFNFPNTAQKLK